jgi:hypothetical protein
MGAVSANQQAEAAQQAADEQVQELERQKGEERLNARSQKSDRAREADKSFASMVAAMADNGGLGTGNASRFAGDIGFVAGMDFARIEGNSISKINSLTSQQRSARMRAANATNQARGAMIGSILGAAGGIAGTVSKERERKRQAEKQKQTATRRTPGVSVKR